MKMIELLEKYFPGERQHISAIMGSDAYHDLQRLDCRRLVSRGAPDMYGMCYYHLTPKGRMMMRKEEE